jgi:catechol 2,3-dioxygenase-like lactoylglutathione lyase family enzyme
MPSWIVRYINAPVEGTMIRLDHLTIFVTDAIRSRDWYVRHFGFKVELEIPEAHTVALHDDADLTFFLAQDAAKAGNQHCVLTFQVDDLASKHRELSEAGVIFEKAPQKLFWGYGAELRDPDGYLIYIWDEKSMREKGGTEVP